MKGITDMVAAIIIILLVVSVAGFAYYYFVKIPACESARDSFDCNISANETRVMWSCKKDSKGTIVSCDELNISGCDALRCISQS